MGHISTDYKANKIVTVEVEKVIVRSCVVLLFVHDAFNVWMQVDGILDA